MKVRIVLFFVLLAGGALPLVVAEAGKTKAPGGWYHPKATQMRGLPLGPFGPFYQ